MKKAQGFTLIEVMVALTIMGVLLAIGAPALSDFLTNSRLRGVAIEIRDGLQGARMEALRCNKAITFTTSGAGWSYTDCSNASRSRTARTNESSLVIKRGPLASPVVIDASNNTITFNSSGRATSGSGQFNISAPGTTYRLQINVNAGGMIRVCNPDTSGNNPKPADAC